MDIVERLREWEKYESYDGLRPTDLSEAADEIERLRSLLQNGSPVVEGTIQHMAMEIANLKAMIKEQWACPELTTLRQKIDSLEPVAWNGGKHGREWTTDKSIAESWLKTETQQAVPLYILDGIKK